MAGIGGKVGVVLRVLIGLAFLTAGVAKLVGVQQMVVEFGKVGFGQWLRYATGIAELIGVGLLARAHTVPAGAAILLGVCAGALYAQAAVLHDGVVHVIVLAALVGAMARIYRPSTYSRVTGLPASQSAP